MFFSCIEVSQRRNGISYHCCNSLQEKKTAGPLCTHRHSDHTTDTCSSAAIICNRSTYKRSTFLVELALNQINRHGKMGHHLCLLYDLNVVNVGMSHGNKDADYLHQTLLPNAVTVPSNVLNILMTNTRQQLFTL